MRISQLNWMQVERYLETDDRCVLPLGSTEQHAYLSLAVDADVAARLAEDAAEPLGIPVFPVLAYGLTPYFMGFPGTVTLTLETLERVVRDILESLHGHGFRRILVVNGHGGNGAARPAAEAWAAAKTDTALRWHEWWKAPRVSEYVRGIDPAASHGSWLESFPWTRVEGVRVPDGHKPPVDSGGRETLTAQAYRERIGDGSLGGYYRRPADEEQALWREAVEETRALLEEGW